MKHARPIKLLGLLSTLAIVAAACGGSGRNNSTASTSSPSGTGGTTASTLVNGQNCPGSLTEGVSGNTIKIGTSLPLSGTYSAFNAILKGETAYFDYVNKDLGGVEVAGKKYQVQLVSKDDAYDPAKTVTNVRALITDNKVFALFNVVGTKNNLAIRDYTASQCVPDLLAATGAPEWGNHQYPWVLGTYLVPYPLEMKAFVDYLNQTKPNATIALLRANDDFGQAYADALAQLVKGTQLKVVATQQYDAEGADTKAQVTKLAATKADAFIDGATLLACPTRYGTRRRRAGSRSRTCRARACRRCCSRWPARPPTG